MNLDGGFEVNGWLAWDLVHSGRPATGCIGPCKCSWAGFCTDDSYRIGFNLYNGYSPLEKVSPSGWLTTIPPLILSRRPLPKPVPAAH